MTTRADVAIHNGNMEIIGGLQNYSRALGQLKTLNTELKLVITNKHDLPVDVKWGAGKTFEKGGNYAQPSQARRLFDAAREENGIYLLTYGLHAFTLRDGRSFRVWVTPKLEGFYYPGTRSEEYEFIDKSARTNSDLISDTAMTHLHRPWALPDEPIRPNPTANFLNEGHYQPLNTPTPSNSTGHSLNQIHPGAPFVPGRLESTANLPNQSHHGEHGATPGYRHETLGSHGFGPTAWPQREQREAGGVGLGRPPAKDTGVVHTMSEGKILLIETAANVRRERGDKRWVSEFPFHLI